MGKELMYFLPRLSSILHIFLLVILPSNVYSACVTIPSTYPLYSSNEIKLKKDISVNSNTVSNATKSPNAAIDSSGTFSKNISQTLPSLIPSSFPSNNSSTDLNITSSTTINQTSDAYYHDIKIKDHNISVSFTGGGTFHIDELKAEKEDITINFSAGSYYIRKFNASKEDLTINVTSSPVFIHIGEEFKTEKENVDINKSGSVDDFIVYLHSGAKVEFKKEKVNFVGVIYGPSNVETVKFEEENNTFRGAIIISGGKIEIKKEDNSFIYTTADQTAVGEIQLDQNCSSGTSDTPANNFNCVENGADGILGKLFTKTTAQSFSFDIIALKDSSNIETDFASGADHTVIVELVNAATSAACNSYPILSPAVSQNLTFISTDSGTKSSSNMISSTAYSTVKCRVTDATDSASVVGCSTDSFAIRPTALTISSNLTNTGSTGIPKAKAGENFTLTATASAGYSGTPTINNSHLQTHSGANQTGNISGSFSAANSATGVATGTTFSYSEVGSLRFTAEGIYDDSFTSVDQSNDCTDDFSNTVVSGKVGCKFGNTSTTDYFGRFTPDHFDVTLNTPVFSASCGTFTYIGQPIKYTTLPIATVFAKNSTGATTQNYTGSFWKINPSDSTYGFTPSYSVENHSLFVLEASPPSYSDSGNGSGTLTFADTSSNILAVTKGALTSPFDAEIALNFTLSDTDGIVVANVDGSAQENPVSFGATSPSTGINFSNKTHRWGRVVLSNAHGSELTPLSIPLMTEYYDGTNFIKNTADSCTNFTLANNVSISDSADFNCTFATQTTPVTIGSGSVKASMSNTTTSNGATEIIISDTSNTANGPGTGNTGYVDITSKLSNLSWLYYDWDANGAHDNCPSARATFGIYKGNDRIIYFREVY